MHYCSDSNVMCTYELCHGKSCVEVFVVVIPKEGLAGSPPHSFFGYDTNYKIVLCHLHRLWTWWMRMLNAFWVTMYVIYNPDWIPTPNFVTKQESPCSKVRMDSPSWIKIPALRVYSRCHTKRRIGWSLPADPSYGMTMTKILRRLFPWHSILCKYQSGLSKYIWT